jgi:hypothetical protein
MRDVWREEREERDRQVLGSAADSIVAGRISPREGALMIARAIGFGWDHRVAAVFARLEQDWDRDPFRRARIDSNIVDAAQDWLAATDARQESPWIARWHAHLHIRNVALGQPGVMSDDPRESSPDSSVEVDYSTQTFRILARPTELAAALNGVTKDPRLGPVHVDSRTDLDGAIEVRGHFDAELES